jgi:hypothetical protein
LIDAQVTLIPLPPNCGHLLAMVFKKSCDDSDS